MGECVITRCFREGFGGKGSPRLRVNDEGTMVVSRRRSSGWSRGRRVEFSLSESSTLIVLLVG